MLFILMLVSASILADNMANDKKDELVQAMAHETETEMESESELGTEDIVEALEESGTEEVSREASFQFAESLGTGINIGNSLDAYGGGIKDNILDYETAWGNPVIRQELFDLVKESGFTSVRIPVTWMEHMSEDGIMDEEWLARVKEVVDYAYQDDLYVILDSHHDTSLFIPTYDNLESALSMTDSMWTQIAQYFSAYDDKLVFEGFNELRFLYQESEWGDGTEEGYDVINQLNQAFVDAVRNTGGNNKERYLMISGYRGGCNDQILDAIEIPEREEHILVSVHTYDPYDFAQNTEGTNVWNIDDSEDREALNRDVEAMLEFISEKKVPVVLTEFGARNKQNEEAREAWSSYYVTKLQNAGISYLWWDDIYKNAQSESYAILDRNNNTVAYPNLVEILTMER